MINVFATIYILLAILYGKWVIREISQKQTKNIFAYSVIMILFISTTLAFISLKP